MVSAATSPAQYPAGSGVGASVLLRQARGFERLSATGEDLQSHGLALAHRPKMCSPRIHLDAAPLAAPCVSTQHHNEVARRDVVLGLYLPFLPRTEPLAQPVASHLWVADDPVKVGKLL